MPDESPINGTIQSILTILVVCIFAPLLTGGAIGLAVEFGGEDLHHQTPEDSNGISVINNDCPTSNFQTTTPSSLSNPTRPNTGVISLEGQNMTKIVHSTGGTSAGNSHFFCESSIYDNYDNLGFLFPSSTFEEDTPYTRIVLDFKHDSTYNYYYRTTEFDFNMTINGTTVIELDNIEVYGYTASVNNRAEFKIDHTLTISEYNDLRNELTDCDPDCDIRFNINDWEQTENCPYSYCNTLVAPPNSMKLKVYESDDISSDLVLTIAPWFFGILCSLIALGSTPYWNPIWKGANNMKDKMRERY